MEQLIQNINNIPIVDYTFPCYNHSMEDIIGEAWKPVVGYEDAYLVSNFGRIKSRSRIVKQWRGGDKRINEQILKQFIDKKGYCQIQLNKNARGKTYPIHRVVAIAWIPNPENKSDVNHKFGIKKDNRVSQLEWLTEQEHNIHTHPFRLRGEKHHYFGKFGALNPRSRPVCQYSLEGEFIKRYASCRVAAKELGVGYSVIYQCCRGVYKTSHNYKWEFEKKQ